MLLLRWFVRLALVVGVLGSALVGAASASADASFVCDGGASGHTYSVSSGTDLTINGGNGDGNCNMSGSIPQNASVTLTGGVGVTAASGSSNAGTFTFATGAVNSGLVTPAGGTFSNSGAIVDDANSNSQALFAASFINTGTIDAAASGSQLLVEGAQGGSNAGVLENESGGRIESQAGATLSINTPMSLKMDAGSSATNAPSGAFNLYYAALDVAGGTVTGTLTLFQSAVTFESSASGSTGTAEVTSPSSLTGEIPAGWTISLSSGGGFSAASGSGNAGTIKFLDSNDAIATPAGGTFTNSGTIIDDATSLRQALYAGTFTNTGTIESAGAGGNLIFDGEQGGSNPGVVVNASGGTLKSDSGANVEFDYPVSLTLDVGSTTDIASGGTLRVNNSALNVAGGTVNGVITDFQAALTFASTAAGSTGTVNGISDFSLTGTIPRAWTVSVSGGGITAAAGAGNAGTLLFEGGNPGLAASGTFTNSGTLALTTGGAQLTAGTLQNTGAITVPAGSLIQVNGTLALSGSSTLNIGVAGLGLTNFGGISVSGSTTLAGTLNVTRSASYKPASGDTQQILTAGSVSGKFSHTLGGNGSGFYTVEYAHTTVTLATKASSARPKPTAGHVSSKNGRLRLKLSCPKRGSSCSRSTITATVTETLRGKKLVAVAASASKASTHKLVVTVARGAVSLQAGASKTLTVSLNATGKALLKKYRKLTMQVTVTSGGKVITTQTITLRAG
jgi:hypothetical protein